MNADSAHFPHLDLEDLIAEVTGRPVADRAREHLARCEHCRTEASRWSLVADGVRGLAAAAAERAQPAQPRPAALRAPAGPRRRVMLAGRAAAALVLLGGAGYGVAAAVTGHAPGTASTGARTARTGASSAVFTAVSGCHGLVQAKGTLDQMHGSSLVIKTATGKPVTVTTTASTMVNIAAAPLSDITDGASVTVAGRRDGVAIAAFAAFGVVIGGPRLPPTHPAGVLVTQGTVADAGTAGFTIVTSGGTRVRVTTSSDTVVHVVHASLGQLQAGATINAVGYLGPDATLSAIAVGQPPPGTSMTFAAGGCSPASIDNAMSRALGD
jgi:hypothetical protein